MGDLIPFFLFPIGYGRLEQGLDTFDLLDCGGVFLALIDLVLVGLFKLSGWQC
jgi:hypothetical protein